MKIVELAIPLMSLLSLLLLLPILVRFVKCSLDRRGTLMVMFSVPVFLMMNASVLPTHQYVSLFMLMTVPAFLLFDGASNRSYNVRSSIKPSTDVLIVAFVPASLFIINLGQNLNLPIETIIGRSVPVLYFITFGIFLLYRQISWEAPILGFICGTLLVNVFSLFVSTSWRACDQFKCGPFGALYIGGYDTENSLAMFGGAALIGSLAVTSGLRRFLLTAVLALALYATESRTAQVSTVIAVVAWVTTRIWMSAKNSDIRSIWVRFVTLSFLILSFSLGLFLINTKDAADFSNRGNTWMQGMAALGNDWPIGLGIDRWTAYQNIGLVPPLFPHSEYLLLLFGGGIIALSVLACVFFRIVSGCISHGASMAGILSFIVYVSITGLTEIYWNPLALDSGTAFAIVFMTFLGVNSGRSRREVGVFSDLEDAPLPVGVIRKPSTKSLG